MLSPMLLARLRVWWRVARAQGKMLDGGWLFPGLNPIEALGTRQLNRAIHDAAALAEIDKCVSVGTLQCYTYVTLMFHWHTQRKLRTQSYRPHPGFSERAAGLPQEIVHFVTGSVASVVVPCCWTQCTPKIASH